MIDKLRLKNIEIHEDTTLEFAPGVTYITGPSDNGKSTICKSFIWIVKNRPSGTGLVQKKKTEAAATLQAGRVRVTREMHVVKKSRTVKLNQYRLNRAKFKALGMKVPEEIEVAVNMNDVNIQGQFDQFFLIQDTPGVVAKKFNNIMGLDIIDETMNKANRIVNKAHADFKAGQNTVEMLLGDLEEFSRLDKIEKLVEKAIALRKKSNDLRRKVASVAEYLIQYENAENEFAEAYKFAGAEDRAKEGLELQTLSDETRHKILKVRKQISLYNTNEEAIRENEDWLKIEGHIPNLQNLVEKSKDTTQKVRLLQKHITAYRWADDKVGRLASILLAAEEARDGWYEANPRCPTCNKEW